MEKYLREWRQDALNKNQYETAIFVADKLLALTNNDHDAFWLAQVHFQTGNFSRAQWFLSRPNILERNPQCRYLHAHCSIKLGKLERALETLGDKNPTHLISAPGSARQKLRHVDVNTRAGARHNKASRSERVPTSEERDKEDSASLKAEAGMCYLRGVCFAKQTAFDQAKECFKTAVQIDVQCYEAFNELTRNCLLSPSEERTFLESLNFDTIVVDNNPSLSQEAAEFTKTLYTTRLSKYSHSEDFKASTETLSTHYNLAENPDILLAKAEFLYINCRFREALEITNSIFEIDKYNVSSLPVHLACLNELGKKDDLFLLAHELVEAHPEEPSTWHAVGVYYITIGRIAEARQFFSKASMMDQNFGPAWIGFAHTFAMEGEHDQAISAYTSAVRLFQGSHLPQIFLGMQNLHLQNFTLAREHFNTAYDLCKYDPLLLNEMGVVYYHENALVEAISVFRRALDIAETNESEKDAWIPTRINLAHALRRAGHLDEALVTFEDVLRHGSKDAGVFSSKGLVLLEMSRPWDAITAFHEALAVSPQDPLASDLLTKALESNYAEANEFGSNVDLGECGGSVATEEDIEELERRMEGKLREIQQNRVAGRGARKIQRAHPGDGGEYGYIAEESAYGESMIVDSDG